jgi:hypothetical protein
MPELTPVFSGTNLRTLLADAHDYVVNNGVLRESSRGKTWSIGALTLVWQNPSNAEENHWSWPVEAADFYQQVFVAGKLENQPERLAKSGDYLFPYTYAARSRFWDGGWGSLLGVLRATQATGMKIAEIFQDHESFNTYLSAAGEKIHLQVLLAVWHWIGCRQMTAWLQDPSFVENFLQRSRVDQLQRIMCEIDRSPGSRRAVTASFVYPDLDQRMFPLQGIPPYQFFQLLPGEAGDPLNSFHVHRSLDAGQGVQLDFLHDYYWLAEVAAKCKRPLGTITITAGDFHVYLPSEDAPAVDRIENWLMAVTDGYQAGLGIPAQWLQKPIYQISASRIYSSMGEKP